MRSLLIGVGLTACWHGPTSPTAPKPPPTPTIEPDEAPSEPIAEPIVEAPVPSYRSTTMAVDAIGIGVMTVGLIGFARDDTSDASMGLALAGLTVSAFGTTVVHGVRGGKGQALKSYLLRAMSATTGMLIGLGAAHCEDEKLFAQLGCAMKGMTWGVGGGLVAASVLDALFMHGSSSEKPRRWAPMIAPGDGGARVGIGGAF